MNIERVIVPPEIIEKIKVKHQVDWWETQEVFFNEEYSFFVLKTHGKYAALGRTYSGRYLLIGFKRRKNRIVEIRTARDMDEAERKFYKRRC